MTPLVSIIIPVYKVEKYIEKCMQSLLDQTYENFEALVVDDGSPDNSITLAKEFVGEDSRFVFLEKENGGQGSARNLALEHAKGKYIAFLDSDDSYTADMLEVVVDEFSKEDDIDILTFGIYYVDEEDMKVFSRSSHTSYFNTDKDILLINKTASRFFWDKVYRRNIFLDHRFSSSIKTYEDVDLIYQVLYKRSIKNIPNCLYNYTQRSNSTVHSLPPSFIEDKYEIVINAKQFLIENNIFQQNATHYQLFYLDELLFQPLLTISKYSNQYNVDVMKLLQYFDTDLLTLKNIYNFGLFKGNLGLLTLLSFKLNRYLVYIAVKLNSLRKKIL